MESWPKITVVLPIRNEGEFIARTIEYLLKQDYPTDKTEIIVAVGDSTDDTAGIVQRIAAEDSRVRYLHNPKAWSSSARNLGAREATGEIVVYVDGHTYIDNDQLLKNTALAMQENGVEVLSRPQFLDTPENTTFQRAVSLARKARLGHGTDSTIYATEDLFVNPASAGASYRKSVFEKVGYFDERFDASEDYEFNYRVSKAGYKAFSSMKLAVYYYPRKTLGALFKQMARYGTGRMRLARKHPETLGFSTLVPPLFLLGLLLWTPLAFVSHWFCYLLGLGYGLFLLAVLATALGIAVNNGIAYLFLTPPIFFMIYLGLGYGFLREWLFGTKLKREETLP